MTATALSLESHGTVTVGSAVVAGLEAALLDVTHRPPPFRAGLIRRPRLVERLQSARDVPLALLVAPAGYGKTTVLAEWAARDERLFAWITLDDRANAPGHLRASIATAVESRPGVLVLDDAGVLHAPEAFEALAELVDHLPPGLQLALASRSDPNLPIGRLRAHRQVVELRCPALAMTRTEAAAMFVRAGLKLDSDRVATLIRRTEGWAAGLYLATLSLAAEADGQRAADTFSGDDRLVADYIRNEILSDLGPDDLAFLQRTSVLDRLTGPLCDAVLEREGSSALLRRLSRSNLLLVPTDRTDERFRYHALFADVLRAELRRTEPGLEPALHGRAGAWHAGRDDPAAAFDHAIAGGDVRRAGELLWGDVPVLMPHGRDAFLHGCLARFTLSEIASEPALALAAATTALEAGDGHELRQWTAAAAKALHGAGQDTSAELAAGVAILRAGTGAAGVRAMGEDAARARRLLAEDGPWCSIGCLFEGVARQLTGDRDGAWRALKEGARRGVVWAPAIETLCLAQLALLDLDSDDVHAAEALIARAAAQAERCALGELPVQALVLAVSALVRTRQGRVDEATRDVRRAGRLLAEVTDFLPWYEAELCVVLARAELALGGVATARLLLEDAARHMRELDDAVSLAAAMQDTRMQLEKVAAAVGDECSLTTAELRVLRFLPSHLSFPEIADKLYVSANTVKTHARAVYRKLQACSRAEAVARARAGGLLDGPPGG